MESAIRVYSIESDEFFSQHISATKIKSHSEARKLAPFLDEHKKPVYWVNWGTTKNNGKKGELILSITPKQVISLSSQSFKMKSLKEQH